MDEKITSRKISGILLGFCGVFFITVLPFFEKQGIQTGDFLGNLLIVIASFTWAIYTVGSRHLTAKKGYSPITISAISIIFSAIIFFFITILTSKQNYIQPIFNFNNFLLIIHLALLVTVATYLLFQWAIKHSSATITSLNNYLQPVLAVWLNVIFLGEKLSLGFILGSLLVIFGVFIATGSQLTQELKKYFVKYS